MLFHSYLFHGKLDKLLYEGTKFNAHYHHHYYHYTISLSRIFFLCLPTLETTSNIFVASSCHCCRLHAVAARQMSMGRYVKTRRFAKTTPFERVCVAMHRRFWKCRLKRGRIHWACNKRHVRVRTAACRGGKQNDLDACFENRVMPEGDEPANAGLKEDRREAL